MSDKPCLGTDHPFYLLMKFNGSSVLKLLGFSPEQAKNYHFDAIILKEKRSEPDIQGIPFLENDVGRILIEFQGYFDKFIRHRVLLELMQLCVVGRYEKRVKTVIVYTEEKYKQAALPLNQVSPELRLDIQEIVLTDYTLEQLLSIDPQLIVLAPFTQSKQIDKQQLKQDIRDWTKTLKQVYASDKQRDALNLLSLFLLDRFRQLSYEEVMQMMHFDLLETRAGQDIYHIGLNDGEDRGIVKGENKRNKEIIRLMLLGNASLETMCKFTGLSEKEVVALKSEIESKT